MIFRCKNFSKNSNRISVKSKKRPNLKYVCNVGINVSIIFTNWDVNEHFRDKAARCKVDRGGGHSMTWPLTVLVNINFIITCRKKTNIMYRIEFCPTTGLYFCGRPCSANTPFTNHRYDSGLKSICLTLKTSLLTRFLFYAMICNIIIFRIIVNGTYFTV